MDYEHVAGHAQAHLEFLETVRDLGFVILRDVPRERERTEEVASLAGKLRMTNYGIFELEAKPDPEIVGDMAMELALHTDEPYRIEPPAITFFHVLAQSDGRVHGVRLLDRGMGPLDAPLEKIEPFYDALRSLLTLIYAGTGRRNAGLQQPASDARAHRVRPVGIAPTRMKLSRRSRRVPLALAHGLQGARMRRGLAALCRGASRS